MLEHLTNHAAHLTDQPDTLPDLMFSGVSFSFLVRFDFLKLLCSRVALLHVRCFRCQKRFLLVSQTTNVAPNGRLHGALTQSAKLQQVVHPRIQACIGSECSVITFDDFGLKIVQRTQHFSKCKYKPAWP